jgi:hypothetical protein
MGNREIVLDLVNRLPEETSLHEIAREIEFIAGVNEGFEEIQNGQGIPIQDLRNLMQTGIAE